MAKCISWLSNPAMKISRTKGKAGLLPITGVELSGNRPRDMLWIRRTQCFDWHAGRKKKEIISLLFAGLLQVWKGNSNLG